MMICGASRWPAKIGDYWVATPTATTVAAATSTPQCCPVRQCTQSSIAVFAGVATPGDDDTSQAFVWWPNVKGKGVMQMKVREVFARNLDLLCDEYGNYSQVARELGITRQQLRKHVHAESLPTERTLARMARFFGVEETDLVDPNFRQNTSSRDYRLARAIEEGLAKTERPDLSTGLYDLYFAWPGSSDTVLRSVVLTRETDGVVEFRRLTSFYDRRQANWRFFRGDHRGLAVQVAGTIYLCGLNRLETYEPSLVALQKVRTSAPLYRGHSIVMNVDGGTVVAVVMTPSPTATMRAALARARTLSLTDSEVPGIVREELDLMRNHIRKEQAELVPAK